MNFVSYGILYYHSLLVQFQYGHTARKDEVENLTAYMVKQKLLRNVG
jgi:hypothetical protein